MPVDDAAGADPRLSWLETKIRETFKHLKVR